MSGAEDFDRAVEPFRTELLAYCYRMLGSVHDAEDLVQDIYLRAWRARARYDATRSSLRTWLYRIATNVCLTALEVRGRRPLPSGLVSASDPLGPLVAGERAAWLQPIPDSMLDAGDPAGTVIDRSSLSLAFAAALQHLSARQRGALILRDVLSFSASEAAEILDTTVVSVNSSLQRARARVKQIGDPQEGLSEPTAAEQRAWVDRYMNAFELADIEGLKRLLTDDVVMEMPPMLNWFTGPGNYGLFMQWVFDAAGTDWYLERIAANGQPGFAAYRLAGGGYELHTIQIFTVSSRGITRNSVFQDSEIFASFGLTARLDIDRQHSTNTRVSSTTVFEAAGGETGLLALAHAWHERVMADEIVSHAFSRGFRVDHSERLAAYWTQALGGPDTYTTRYGDESFVVREHSGNGPHDEMNDRAIACFDQALDDVGLTRENPVHNVLHDYFAWSTPYVNRFERSADDVPQNLQIPGWSWNGLSEPID